MTEINIPIDAATLKLLNEMGFYPSEKDPKLYEIEVGKGKAYVDFRKEDGRRYANVEGKIIKGDNIPILQAFKEARDKILQSSSAGTIAELPAGPPKRFPGENLTTEKTKLGTRDILKSSGVNKPLPDSATDLGDKSPRGCAHTPDTGENREANIPGNMGQETIPPPILKQNFSPGVKIPPAPTFNLYEFLFDLVGAGGIIEIFGNTGTLKSSCCTLACQDAKRIGKTHYYLDTEGKIGLFNRKVVEPDYKYIPGWFDMVKAAEDMPKRDLLIVDSVGFPISAKTAGMKLDEQGQAWNDMMSLVGDTLKSWAYKNNAIVIIINQPKSDFMKSEAEKQRPDALGDKVHFAPNIILRVTKVTAKGYYDDVSKKVVPPSSLATFVSHRSPDFMDDAEIFSIRKNDNETIIEMSSYVRKRLAGINGSNGTKIVK